MTDTAPLRELLRRSVKTMAAVPDNSFPLGPRTAWPDFVRHARDAYGAAPPRFKDFHPVRADLTVYLEALSWINWYSRTYGSETPRVFVAWCMGAAMWQLQERVSTNRRRPAAPRTVYNRMDAMVLAIASEYPDATRKCVDNHPEVQILTVARIEGDGMSSDARDLPRSPPTWRTALPPMPPAEQASAHAALTKQLRRNQSRALKRAAKPHN